MASSLPPDPMDPSSTIASEVKAQTQAAIAESERRILAGIEKAVSDAVETRYKVVIAQIGESKEKSTRSWQLLLAVIPIVLTIALGSYVSWKVTKAQTDIGKKIDDQRQELTTRLALTQEYQKRKLDAYLSCTKTLNTLRAALQTLNVDPNDQKAASDAVAELNDCTYNSSLYVTKNVAEPLAEAQQDAVVIMQKARSGVNIAPFEAARATAEKRMLDELTGVTVQLEPSR